MSDTIPSGLLDQSRWQAGLISREQALRVGLSSNAITSKLVHARWQQIHRGVYATFTGPPAWEARLWAAVLYAGPGARLSHETAAELIRLTDRRSPFIHMTIPPYRRVKPPQGVLIHISSYGSAGWRFARGVPPHTLTEETVIDLVHAATDLNDVIAYVTAAFGRKLTSEDRLRREAAGRGKLRWRADLDQIIPAAAGGAHSVIEYRYDRDVERAHGLPPATRQVPFSKPSGSRGFRDRYYEKYRLIIELDGKQYHPDEQRGRDQDRDNHAAATAGSTLRYGWIDVTTRRCASAAQVHAALTRRGYTGALRPCSPTCGALVPKSALLLPARPASARAASGASGLWRERLLARSASGAIRIGDDPSASRAIRPHPARSVRIRRGPHPAQAASNASRPRHVGCRAESAP